MLIFNSSGEVSYVPHFDANLTETFIVSSIFLIPRSELTAF